MPMATRNMESENESNGTSKNRISRRLFKTASRITRMTEAKATIQFQMKEQEKRGINK